MNVNNWAFSIEVESARLLYKALGSRPSSAPYLSGDGFRSLCGRFYEGEGRFSFDAAKVKAGDRVFCESWHLREFLQGPGKEIHGPCSVISHNGDMNIDRAIAEMLPFGVSRLFAQNVTVGDPRISPLPIGLENRRLHCNGIPRDFDFLRKKPAAKMPRILSAFSVGTNVSARGPAAEQLAACAVCDSLPRTNSRAYRSLASRYMFIASPPGNGIDCHRTWEAMYLGSVPIVLRSEAMAAFEAQGMPLFIVDSYSEVAAWTQAKAASVFEEMAPRFGAQSLWFDYWKNIITGQNAE
jgi:hypothetical protein